MYGNQVANKLPGSNQNYYFRTITIYDVDANGKPTGSTLTGVYYAPKAAARTFDGKTWNNGSESSLNTFERGGWVLAATTNDGGKTLDFLNYTQDDVDRGIVSADKVGTPVLGATAQQSLATSGGIFYETIQNNIINTAVNTKPGLAQVVSVKQKNAVQQQLDQKQQEQAAAQAAAEEAAGPQASEVQAINISATVSDGYVRKDYGASENLRYPESLKLETQDCIQFKMFRYGSRSIDASTEEKALNLKLPNRELTEISGTVTLPIQPSITDSNGVDWGGANLSPADAYFASLARGAMEGEGGAAAVISGLASRVSGDLKKALGDSDIKNAMLTYFTQEAVGIQGLLSRTAGAVLNPNLELLFNGPTLRPFNFTFRLSPRSEKEAANVRRIIRFFKQGMSVKTSPSSIFLKAPNVFEIKYLTDGKNHTSLNRIKKCALLGCEVDYTPDGTYMTFNDEAKTMTSYQLSLRFSELEPIYEEDYNKDGLSETDTQIGY